MLRFGVRDRVMGFFGSAPKLPQALQGSGVVQTLVLDQPGSDDCSGSALAAPAVDVDDLAGVEFLPDVIEDLVVARIVDDVGVGDFEAVVFRETEATILGLGDQRVRGRASMVARPRPIRPLRSGSRRS